MALNNPWQIVQGIDDVEHIEKECPDAAEPVVGQFPLEYHDVFKNSLRLECKQ